MQGECRGCDTPAIAWRPVREKQPRLHKEPGFCDERDGARTRNHRIDSLATNSQKQGESEQDPLRLSNACATRETDSTLLALLDAWPKLTEKQQRQVVALVALMAD